MAGTGGWRGREPSWSTMVSRQGARWGRTGTELEHDGGQTRRAMEADGSRA